MYFFLGLNPWTKGYVEARGTWVMQDAKPGGDEEQVTQITCFRDSGLWIESTALVSRDTLTSVLLVFTDIYDIESWDDVEIVTKPKDALCARVVKRMNRVQNSITAIRSTISTNGLCSGLERREIHLKLEDPFKVYWRLHQQQRAKYLELTRIPPDLIKLLKVGELEGVKTNPASATDRSR
jgi:hypothetical protein